MLEDKEIRETIDKSFDAGKKEMKKKVCKWLTDNISHYIIMEYNEFHHQCEYEGFDVDGLIRDLKKNVK